MDGDVSNKKYFIFTSKPELKPIEGWDYDSPSFFDFRSMRKRQGKEKPGDEVRTDAAQEQPEKGKGE